MRWYKSRSLVIFIVIAVFAVLGFSIAFNRLQSIRWQTSSVRLTSRGTVRWDENEVPLSNALATLEQSANSLKSAGFKAQLLIESYQDAKPADVQQLQELGNKAGFDAVALKRLDWAKPSDNSDD